MRFHPARFTGVNPDRTWDGAVGGLEPISLGGVFFFVFFFFFPFFRDDLSLSLRPYYVVGRSGLAVFIRQFLISFSWPLIERHYFVAGLFRFKWHSKRCNHCQRNYLSNGPTNPNALLSSSSSSLYYNHFKYLRTGFIFLVFFFSFLAPARPARLLHWIDFYNCTRGRNVLFRGIQGQIVYNFFDSSYSMSRQVNWRKKGIILVSGRWRRLLP